MNSETPKTKRLSCSTDYADFMGFYVFLICVNLRNLCIE